MMLQMLPTCQVFATATEDMDALTFRTPKLLRRFTSSQGKEKQPIIEVDFALMLAGKASLSIPLPFFSMLKLHITVLMVSNFYNN